MTKDEESRARKLAEQAEDRERMARIVKRHQKPASLKTITRPEEVDQHAAGVLREAPKR